MSHDVVEDNNAEYNEDDVLGPLRAEPLGLDTETDAHITRDRSTRCFELLLAMFLIS